MRILFDNGTPRGLAPFLDGHMVEEARLHGWEALVNGELIDAAELAGFDIMLTTDKNILHQQNLTGRRLTLLVLENSQWPMMQLVVPAIVDALNAAQPGTYVEIAVPSKRSKRAEGL